MLQKSAAIVLIALAVGGLVYYFLRQRQEEACKDCALRDECSRRKKISNNTDKT